MRKLARKTTSTHRNAKSRDPRDHRLHRHSSSDIKDKSLSFELAAFPNTFPHLLAVKEVSERASGGFVRLCSCNPLCGVTRYKSEKASPPVGRTEIPGKADLFGFTLSFCSFRHALSSPSAFSFVRASISLLHSPLGPFPACSLDVCIGEPPVVLMGDGSTDGS